MTIEISTQDPTREVSDLQTRRKREERLPMDWNTYREALIASGLVEERRLEREEV